MMDKIKKYRNIVLIAGGILVLVFPLLFPQESVMAIAVRVLIYMILASGLNISNGYIGLFNIGSAGFFCIGAYTSALLSTRCGMPFLVSMLASVALTTVVGGLMAFPTSRFSGFYFSITTMGFSEIVRLIALNWVSLTRGSNGIHSIPRPEIFGFTLENSTHYYYFILILLGIVLFSIRRILKSRVGRAWLSIRENPDAARSLGVPITQYKALNFMTMGFILGLGGCLMAYYYRYISPEMFQIDNGHQVLAMVNLGGLGSLAGPLLGAAIISVAMEALRFAAEYRMIVYALIVLVMMWLCPQGLLGAKDTVMAAQASRKKKKTKQNNEASAAGTGE